jgi:predicted transcriptional regulator
VSHVTSPKRESAPAAHREKRTLLISIHSHYANLILSGRKRVELRRRFDVGAAGSRMLIYATSPTAAVVGYVRIDDVECLATNEIWNRYGEVARISAEDFQNYYAGAQRGCAVLISNPVCFSNPIPLRQLRNEHGISAPQSYIILRDAHRELIEHEQN